LFDILYSLEKLRQLNHQKSKRSKLRQLNHQKASAATSVSVLGVNLLSHSCNHEMSVS